MGMRAKARDIPFDFVLEALQGLDLRTRAMFGCESVYVGDKIVLILRQKGKPAVDDGIWIATEREHHESLIEEFPPLRSISLFGGDTDWQVLPVDDERFEELALRLCELIHSGDPRLGRAPKSRISGPRKKKKAVRKKKTVRK